MNISSRRDEGTNPVLAEQREALSDRLGSEGRDDLAKPLDRCGWMADFRCQTCGALHVKPDRCKRRFCPVCAPLLAARLVTRYRATVGNIEWPLFTTWTAMHTPLFPIAGFSELFEAMKKVRRQRWFSEKVRGGIVSGEISNCGKNGWHLHLHSILDTRWLSVSTPAPRMGADAATVRMRGQQAQRDVSAQWSLALSRPGSVQSQRCSGPEAIVECLKYAVKPGDLISSPDPIAPIIDMMRRCRLVRSWGCMYGHLRDAEEEPIPQACDLCGDAAGVLPADVYERKRARGVCG